MDVIDANLLVLKDVRDLKTGVDGRTYRLLAKDEVTALANPNTPQAYYPSRRGNLYLNLKSTPRRAHSPRPRVLILLR